MYVKCIDFNEICVWKRILIFLFIFISDNHGRKLNDLLNKFSVIKQKEKFPHKANNFSAFFLYIHKTICIH